MLKLNEQKKKLKLLKTKTKIIMKLNLLILFITFSISIFAQTGNLQGTIVEASSKDEMIGAKIFVLNTDFRAIADIYGIYKINNIPVGTYTIEASVTGYATYNAEITITANETTVHNIEIEENVTEMEGVKIVAARKTDTDNAIVLEIKEAKAVVSGVSSEQISRSTDKTAAEAMQRIPGITIVDNKFALIRGVNTRYNNVMINNVIAPSTEVDRRTFSFDMISSGSLDRMMIYKTPCPD